MEKEKVKATKVQKIVMGLALTLIVVILGAEFINSNTPKESEFRSPVNTQQTTTQPKVKNKENETIQEEDPIEDTIAYKLATVNGGGYVSEDDVTINRFQYLLEEIESKTVNTSSEIGDMTVAGHNILVSDYGVDMSLLEFMEAANDSIPNDAKSEPILKYEEIVTLLIGLIVQ